MNFSFIASHKIDILEARLDGCPGEDLVPSISAHLRRWQHSPNAALFVSNGSLGAAAFPFILAAMAEKVRAASYCVLCGITVRSLTF